MEPRHSKGLSLATGAACWYLTTVIVLLGALFGVTFLRCPIPWTGGEDVIARLAGGDGFWYRSIADNGYRHGPGFSDTAFFPVFPLSARGIADAFRMPTETALLVVANLSLLAAFVTATLLSHGSDRAHDVRNYTLLSFGLMPTTFFFRMAYAEPVFVLVILVALRGIARRWSPVLVALLVGLATATRPTGVALVPPFVLYVWRRFSWGRDKHSTILGAITEVSLRQIPLLALACWGLIAFVSFQWVELQAPLASAKSQLDCRLTLAEDVSLGHKALAMAMLDPVWTTYVPSKPQYWARYELHDNPIFSLQFANPIYFVGTIVLVIIGWRKKWLNEYELLLSAGLLAIPYVTKSYDNAMASFGRFSAVVLPAYIVMGHLLHRMGPALAAIVLALMAVMLFIYSAMFAAGYRMI
jgi:hypothetical protein